MIEIWTIFRKLNNTKDRKAYSYDEGFLKEVFKKKTCCNLACTFKCFIKTIIQKQDLNIKN